ncbi:MAG: 4-hydroxy-tetrahydrodipicolinate reductase [Roseburia sp.]|nr:4-hydroxy-tetrahydrodipicolinate reductase [Roseburia sp.]
MSVKAFVFGINGKMGKMLADCAQDFDFEITGGFDVSPSPDFPTFSNANDVNVPFDVIIDFSRPQTLPALISLAVSRGTPAVIATTGYSDEETENIRALSRRVPVFRSGNMSLGIAAAKAAAVAVKSILGDGFDIEIVEKHHNQKADSPSGTALMLADALSEKDKQIINRNGKRRRGELGITSVRGGTVVGEHEIGFYGEDEIVTISHSARSRRLFASGAFEAARFLLTAKPDLYGMDDLTKVLTSRADA